MSDSRGCAPVALALTILALTGPEWSASSERGSAPTTIGVRNAIGNEFSFYLSRTKVAPGPALVQYQNTGEDPHDLKMQRVGGTTELATGVVAPGMTGSVTTKLKRSSTYRLWCSLDGHVEKGMEAFIQVKKRRRNGGRASGRPRA